MSGLQQDIQEIAALKDKFKQFVHGGLNTVVSTESGQWPSIPSAIDQATQTAISGVEQLKNDAESAADASGDSAAAASDAATLAQQTVAGIDQDKAATAADRVQTGKDRNATSADRDQAAQDAQATAADRVQTGEDRAATGADRTQIALDVLATAADRMQTTEDRAAINADRNQTAQDVLAAAADRTQTGLDAIATAEDRSQTAQDVIATGEDLSAVQTALAATIAARDTAQQSASAVTSGLFFAGGWDASTGIAPPTPVNGSAFYRITAGGTIDGVGYTTKDEICWDHDSQSWFLVGGSSGVDKVNGKTGIVNLTAEDVGALPASDAGTAATKNVSASGNAAADDVVLGSDSRLTDPRAPTNHGHQISEVTGLRGELDAKLASADVVDDLATSSTEQPLSAQQGVVLKGLIDSLAHLMTSDDASLDQLQEIVEFIKANKSTLDNLGIASVLGLQAALNAKASISALNTKANLSSPAFTGSPRAPTQSASTDDTSIATTEFVKSALNSFNPAAAPPTADQVGAAIAGQTFGAIGTYVFARNSSGVDTSEGQITQGGNIFPISTNIGAYAFTALTGSWMTMGSGIYNHATVYMRVA